MNKLQRIANTLDNPRVVRRVHGWMAVAWFIWAFPSMLTGLKNSVPYLIFISIYTIVVGHWTGWDAAGSEVQLEELHKKQDESDK